MASVDIDLEGLGFWTVWWASTLQGWQNLGRGRRRRLELPNPGLPGFLPYCCSSFSGKVLLLTCNLLMRSGCSQTLTNNGVPLNILGGTGGTGGTVPTYRNPVQIRSLVWMICVVIPGDTWVSRYYRGVRAKR